MIEQEIVTAVNYANAIDPRVQSNQPTYELWHRVLSKYEFVQAQAAIQLFYERYADPSSRPVVDPASVRRIINHETERSVAVTQAIEPRKPVLTEPRIRQRVLDRFRAEYEAGVRQGNGERAYNMTLRTTGDRRQAMEARREAEAA